jgi:hypothetical protein
MSLLDMPLLASLRRNHAMEHATMHILARRQPYLSVVARTTLDGFQVYGKVATEDLADAASEALTRLQGGESELAVHPRCGTNLAVAGFLAGLATFIAMGRGKSRLSKFPRFVLAATLALIVAQPLGMLFQERVTTSPHVASLRIKNITQQQFGRFTIHKVDLEKVY